MRHVFGTRLCKDVGVEAVGAGVAVAVSFQPRYDGPASWAGGIREDNVVLRSRVGTLGHKNEGSQPLGGLRSGLGEG